MAVEGLLSSYGHHGLNTRHVPGTQLLGILDDCFFSSHTHIILHDVFLNKPPALLFDCVCSRVIGDLSYMFVLPQWLLACGRFDILAILLHTHYICRLMDTLRHMEVSLSIFRIIRKKMWPTDV